MGNLLNVCCGNHTSMQSELSMETEPTNLEKEYLRKTTSDDVLKILLSRSLRDSVKSKSYSAGTVKVLVF